MEIDGATPRAQLRTEKRAPSTRLQSILRRAFDGRRKLHHKSARQRPPAMRSLRSTMLILCCFGPSRRMRIWKHQDVRIGKIHKVSQRLVTPSANDGKMESKKASQRTRAGPRHNNGTSGTRIRNATLAVIIMRTGWSAVKRRVEGTEPGTKPTQASKASDANPAAANRTEGIWADWFMRVPWPHDPSSATRSAMAGFAGTRGKSASVLSTNA